MRVLKYAQLADEGFDLDYEVERLSNQYRRVRSLMIESGSYSVFTAGETLARAFFEKAGSDILQDFEGVFYNA